MERRRNSVWIRRSPWLALILGVAPVVWHARQNRIERLTVIPPAATGMTVRNGRLYWIVEDSVQFAIRSMSVKGGRVDDLAREDLSHAWIPRTVFTDTHIFYFKSPGKSSITGGLGPTPQASVGPNRYLGIFLRPARDHAKTGEKRTILYPASGRSTTAKTTLNRVSFTGGGTHLLQPDTGGAPIDALWPVFDGDRMYWVRSHREPTLKIHDANGIRYERYASDDLMVSPLDGGPATKVTGSLYGDSLYKSGLGVCWSVPRCYPDQRVDSYCVESGVVKRVPSDARDDVQSPVRFQGRYYWLERQRSQHGGLVGDGEISQIVAANADGTERRVVLSPKETADQRIRYSRLVAHRGRIYVLYSAWKPDPVPGEPNTIYASAKAYIAVLKPGAPNPIQGAKPLPDDSVPATVIFDGDYCYFAVTESRSNWFGRPADNKIERVLCRFRRPE